MSERISPPSSLCKRSMATHRVYSLLGNPPAFQACFPMARMAYTLLHCFSCPLRSATLLVDSPPTVDLRSLTPTYKFYNFPSYLSSINFILSQNNRTFDSQELYPPLDRRKGLSGKESSCPYIYWKTACRREICLPLHAGYLPLPALPACTFLPLSSPAWPFRLCPRGFCLLLHAGLCRCSPCRRAKKGAVLKTQFSDSPLNFSGCISAAGVTLVFSVYCIS